VIGTQKRITATAKLSLQKQRHWDWKMPQNRKPYPRNPKPSLMIKYVHLTIESSRTYVNEILYYADNLFTTEVVSLVEGTSNKPERIGRKKEKNQLESDFRK
jgi:hypothetical protein